MWEILLSIALGLAVNECCEISPWFARRLVRLAAKIAYSTPERARDRGEEWAAVIDDRPGKLLKLGTALGFLLGAVTLGPRRVAARGVAHVTVSLSDMFIKVTPSMVAGNVTVTRLILRLAGALGSRGARWRLAELLEELGRPDDALVVWSRAALDDQAARLLLAAKLERAGRFDDAVKVSRMAVAAGDPGAWHRIAALLARMGRIDSAIRVWQESAAAGEPMARTGLADLLEMIGSVDEAIALRKLAIEVGDPGAREAFRAMMDRLERGAFPHGQTVYGPDDGECDDVGDPEAESQSWWRATYNGPAQLSIWVQGAPILDGFVSEPSGRALTRE